MIKILKKGGLSSQGELQRKLHLRDQAGEQPKKKKGQETSPGSEKLIWQA